MCFRIECCMESERVLARRSACICLSVIVYNGSSVCAHERLVNRVLIELNKATLSGLNSCSTVSTAQHPPARLSLVIVRH